MTSKTTNSPRDSNIKRHGTAVDRLDKICQKWKRCHNCIALDSDDMECFSDSEAYNVTYKQEANNFNCNDQRDSICAFRNTGNISFSFNLVQH